LFNTVFLNIIFRDELLTMKTFTSLNKLTVGRVVQLLLNYCQAYIFAKSCKVSLRCKEKNLSLLTELQGIFGIFRAITKFQNFCFYSTISRETLVGKYCSRMCHPTAVLQLGAYIADGSGLVSLLYESIHLNESSNLTACASCDLNSLNIFL